MKNVLAYSLSILLLYLLAENALSVSNSTGDTSQMRSIRFLASIAVGIIILVVIWAVSEIWTGFLASAGTNERGAREYRENDPNQIMWPYVFTSGKPVRKKHWDRLYSGGRRRFGGSNPSDYTGDDINSVDGGPPSDAD